MFKGTNIKNQGLSGTFGLKSRYILSQIYANDTNITIKRHTNGLLIDNSERSNALKISEFSTLFNLVIGTRFTDTF